ncbi:Kae1-like domain-containing protein, partial [Roseateles sp. GG27B]
MGDLENALTQADFRSALADSQKLFAQLPQIIAVDQHPEYLSTKLGHVMVGQSLDAALRLAPVQHHHAHLAACLAENGVALTAAPVIGVALDGLGYGEAGELWGGEFFHVDYRQCKRLATFKPVAMLGAAKAMQEPWRNTYAHLMAEMGWPRFANNYQELELFRLLEAKPRQLLEAMSLQKVNSPLASSCGRLFDAAAAAVGLCFERVRYEGQAAIEFEALADADTLENEDDELAYPFGIPRLKDSRMPYVEPLGMWQALLGDLILATPVSVMSARFHKGLAIVIARMVDKLSRHESPDLPIKTV